MFDDFESEVSLLQRFLPESTRGHGSVLITSRRPPENQGTAIEVKPFGSDEGARFLLSLLTSDVSASVEEEERTSAVALARRLDSFALDLELVADSIKANKTSITAFLKESETQLRHRPSHATSGLAYTRSLDSVFASAVAGLSSQAGAILQSLVFLDPDGLDESLLLAEVVANDDKQ